MRVKMDGEAGLMDSYLRGDKATINSIAQTKREWLSLMGRGWVRVLMYGVDAGGDAGDEGGDEW